MEDSANKESFEEKVKFIEAILGRLENEEIPLEESLKLYAKGSSKIKEARQMLEQAEIIFQEIKQDHADK